MPKRDQQPMSGKRVEELALEASTAETVDEQVDAVGKIYRAGEDIKGTPVEGDFADILRRLYETTIRRFTIKKD